MREVNHIKVYQQNTVQRTPSKEQNIEDLELSDAGMKELLEQTLAQNTEMMKLLANYERFFGALYAETPESFDPNVAVDKR
ncbi:hypothetical protein, partial [Salmonella sp. s55004]|uniref:hypothetical protein n=1 Tax=Salmonella sp. s55004 TaxID=3159675 RepID=UPI00397F6644